ncbi:MAG: 3-oxoacyl-ACP reductase [Gammaproteobacteria bacterium 39-13]|nr:3-oxoacyl-ACP reductase FabG [Gammaproteobacteria bacterium]OJV91836.1 MAG: 3-oxoacyl-ACP reductase [Gammaproteobacteria bacterium 39-13]
MWQLSSLEGKVALVTGASRGIGQAIAKTLGQMGATVIGSATTEQGAQAISKFLEQHNLKGYGITLDVSQPSAVEQCLKSITDDVGAPLILVNNAGLTRDNLVMRMKDEEWDATLATNLTGVYRLSKACLKGMLKAKWGRIISLSSIVGITGNAGQANYAATKAGVIAFSKSLAKEIATRGITVNVVAPGFIDTDMTREIPQNQREALFNTIPMGYMGHPDDIAASVAFLASEQARYITGETIHVNGGMLMD